MSACSGCGGVVGIDCFRPSECEEASEDMERRQLAYQVETLRAQLEAAEAEIAVMRERMHFLATDGAVEGFVNVDPDIYDYACDSAEENGREQPNDDDLTDGLCRLIDAARTKEETK